MSPAITHQYGRKSYVIRQESKDTKITYITRLIFMDNTFFHGTFKNRDIKHGCSFETLISIA